MSKVVVSEGTPPRTPLPGGPRPVIGGELAAKMLFGFVLFVLGIGLLWYFSRLIIYLLIGIIIAFLLRPLVLRMQGLGLARIPAILLTFLLVFGGIGMAVASFAPSVAAQVRLFAEQFSPALLAEVAQMLERQLGRVVRIEPGALVAAIERGWNALFQEERIAATLGSVVGLFTNLLYATLVIPLVSFFFLKDGVQIRHNLLRLVPNRYFEIALTIVEKIEANIGRYFRALLLQCLSVATVAAITLTFAGLDSAIAVGVFAGIANMIPYFGPLMGFFAGMLAGVAQTGDFALVPGVFVAMALTQLADNVFFQPLFFSRAAQAHPLVILFAVLTGAQVAGIVGMLVAIPVATAIRVTAQQVIWSLRNYRILKVV